HHLVSRRAARVAPDRVAERPGVRIPHRRHLSRAFRGPARDEPVARGDSVRLAHIPVLAAEPAFQHTTRIYLVAGIDRSNSLFVPLISLSAGMMLGLLHSFSARRWLT